MRRWRASLALMLVVVAGCSDLRVKLAVYNSVDDARAGGAMTAGWVPDGVPASAGDLRVGYMPDGRQWGVFAFQSSGADAVRALIQDEITSGTITLEPPGRLEFWPQILRRLVEVEHVRTTGLRIYRGRDARTYAINWGQGRAYYWK